MGWGFVDLDTSTNRSPFKRRTRPNGANFTKRSVTTHPLLLTFQRFGLGVLVVSTTGVAHPRTVKQIIPASPVERKLINHRYYGRLTAQAKAPPRFPRAGLALRDSS